MRRVRSDRGLTLLEVTIAVVLIASVAGGALALLDSSNALTRSVNDQRAAALRVDRALASISDEFRKGSLATAVHLDGTTFGDGESGTGFQIRPVRGWNGSVLTGDLVRYEFELPTGATEGELVRTEGGVETVLVRGITSFDVSRSGNVFVFKASSRSGPTDDRERRASGEIRVMARNP